MSALARWLAALLARAADRLEPVARCLPLEPGQGRATPEERLRDLRHRLGTGQSPRSSSIASP